jgi:hypothetical protein
MPARRIEPLVPPAATDGSPARLHRGRTGAGWSAAALAFDAATDMPQPRPT